MKIKHLYLVLFTICLFASCGGGNKTNRQKTDDSTLSLIYEPQYARGYKMGKINDVKVLQVTNPWQGASGIEFTYYLKPDADPKKTDEIKTPVNKVICLSTTHIAYINAIDKTQAVCGVSGASYVSNPKVQQGIAEKRVVDVGYDSGLMYETVVSLQPDVVFAYGVSGELTGISTKLNELGIKVVYLGDYLEESPLGKAEWLVAIASFFNAEEQAEKKLEPIFSEYNKLTEMLKAMTTLRPKVMLNAPWKDTWYIPGGKSYLVNMIKDAGADFVLGDNDNRESSPINLERAYLEASKAEYWLNPNAAQSLADVKREDERLASIPAFKNCKVYNNNARTTPGGGSDFWESGVMNPHIILQDLVKIFHANLLPEHELVYFHQLK